MIEGNGVHTLKIKKLSLAVCLAFLPMSSNAAGLGKLTVTSNLGEPFKGTSFVQYVSQLSYDI